MIEPLSEQLVGGAECRLLPSDIATVERDGGTVIVVLISGEVLHLVDAVGTVERINAALARLERV